MKSRSISINFDDETFKEHKISRGVKKISGIIKMDKDYKSLRDMIIDEKIDRYENLH